ncbi:reverse transcriptase [Plakobranchus ocellatus]|uniref:Reverse transcriptase n=1 Tax=Plakobranchus ocellatus TaxID=259542 RepID=A0AAV3ZMW4_9GAST|nr:reverse transcriptase [Plakobranchus ocellatus]
MDFHSRLDILGEMLSAQSTSDYMMEVCRLLGIKQKLTTSYHPMSNGLGERFNATLKTCLRRMGTSTFSSLPIGSAAGVNWFCLFQLLHGRTICGPKHILRELWTKEIQEPGVR